METLVEVDVDVLANWLWQGCAVAVAATVMLRASRRLSATTRYHLWWVTLVTVLLLPVVSLQLPASRFQLPALSFRLPASNSPQVVTQQSGDSALNGFAGSLQPEAGSLVLPSLPSWTVSLLALLWATGTAISLARTAAALATLRRAKRTSRPFPEATEMRLQTWLSLRSRGRQARLALSDDVRAAAVLGLTSPSIAVAPSALGALSDRELDQIVVHEWAHVQRRDDIARLVQRILVAIAGLHPAVWWIDRQLHLERETACDDWAVNATGSAKSLALCLTKIAALPGRRPDPVLVPAALLSSELTTRVVRLLDAQRNTSTARTLGAPMFVAPVLAALALVVASVELVVTSAEVPNRPHQAAAAIPAVVPSAAVDRDEQAPAGSPPSAEVHQPAHKPQSTRRISRAPRVPAATPGDVSEPQEPTQSDLQGLLEPKAQSLQPSAPGAVAPVPSSQDSQERAVPINRPVDAGGLRTEDLPGTSTPLAPVTAAASGRVAAQEAEPGNVPTVWGAAADAGVTVGKGSQKAAVATAGFFTRLSKSIAGVF